MPLVFFVHLFFPNLLMLHFYDIVLSWYNEIITVALLFILSNIEKPIINVINNFVNNNKQLCVPLLIRYSINILIFYYMWKKYVNIKYLF